MAVEEIYNFVQVTENLGTGGQATVEQFADLAQAGYEMVINLAPSDVSHAIPNEGEIVQAQGMDYLQIPVIWQNPTLEDWNNFVAAMDANQEKKVFVHCIANMRVSAFVMLYRHIKLGLTLADAQAPMLKIWNPEERHPDWVAFIETVMKQ